MRYFKLLRLHGNSWKLLRIWMAVVEELQLGQSVPSTYRHVISSLKYHVYPILHITKLHLSPILYFQNSKLGRNPAPYNWNCNAVMSGSMMYGLWTFKMNLNNHFGFQQYIIKVHFTQESHMRGRHWMSGTESEALIRLQLSIGNT